MAKVFSRWLPCATLAAWSAIMLYYSDLWSGKVDAFLVPQFRWYIAAAGFLLGAMALVFALFPADAECCITTDCSHPLSRFAAGKWLSFLVLIVPFTAVAVVSPKGYSQNSMLLQRGALTDASSLPDRKISVAPVDLPLPTKDGAPAAATPAPTAANAKPAAPAANDYIERTPEGYLVADVLDLLYAVQDGNLRKDFEGKTVQMIGQLMPDTSNNPNGTRFKAVRMFMTCCAADARPVAALVEAQKQPELPEMSWVRIVGTATFPIENGRRISVIRADKVDKCDPPADAMLY